MNHCYIVGEITPPQDLSPLYRVDPSVDLVVFGFQEIVNLNPAKALLDGHKKEKQWIATLNSNMHGYIQEAVIREVGMFLTVYKRKDAVFTVSDVHIDKVGTGPAGFGNKGGVGISMTLNGSFKLVFVNCHLAAHQDKAMERAADFQAISQKLKFKGSAKTVYDHHAIIWVNFNNNVFLDFHCLDG